MPPEAPPPADDTVVWLLLEPGQRPGHKMMLGVFASYEHAQAARAQSGHGLWLWRVPVGRLERI